MQATASPARGNPISVMSDALRVTSRMPLPLRTLKIAPIRHAFSLSASAPPASSFLAKQRTALPHFPAWGLPVFRLTLQTPDPSLHNRTPAGVALISGRLSHRLLGHPHLSASREQNAKACASSWVRPPRLSPPQCLPRSGVSRTQLDVAHGLSPALRAKATRTAALASCLCSPEPSL